MSPRAKNGDHRLTFWLLQAVFAVAMFSFGAWTNEVSGRVTEVSGRLYTHEIQAVGGYSRISALEERADFVERRLDRMEELR